MILDDDPRAYVRLANAIRKQIANGDLKSGSPVPPIGRINQETGHARQTVGKAFQLLEREGVIKRYPGRGYYVMCATHPETEGSP